MNIVDFRQVSKSILSIAIPKTGLKNLSRSTGVVSTKISGPYVTSRSTFNGVNRFALWAKTGLGKARFSRSSPAF